MCGHPGTNPGRIRDAKRFVRRSATHEMDQMKVFAQLFSKSAYPLQPSEVK